MQKVEDTFEFSIHLADGRAPKHWSLTRGPRTRHDRGPPHRCGIAFFSNGLQRPVLSCVQAPRTGASVPTARCCVGPHGRVVPPIRGLAAPAQLSRVKWRHRVSRGMRACAAPTLRPLLRALPTGHCQCTPAGSRLVPAEWDPTQGRSWGRPAYYYSYAVTVPWLRRRICTCLNL